MERNPLSACSDNRRQLSTGVMWANNDKADEMPSVNKAVPLTPAEHRDELLGVLRHVLRDTRGPALKRLPTRYAASILSDLNGKRIDPHSIDHSIRQIHDFYGWMAKANPTRGHCAGAIYRTERYMDIPRNSRDGSKKPTRNVHIEHTVPIKTLRTVIKARQSEFASSEQLHRFMLNHSVCVAFSREEEKWLPPDGDWNDAFLPTGQLGHDYPFRRYRRLFAVAKQHNATIRIINVLTGCDVDIESYTFRMHSDSLMSASRALAGAGGPYLYGLEAFRHDMIS